VAVIDLVLPYPPSVNHYYRTVRGRMLISAKGRQYHQLVAAVVWQAGRPRIEGRLAVRLQVWTPDKRERDLDNLLKPLLDALANAGVYASDGQIDDLSLVRCGVLAAGRVDVTVTSLVTPDPPKRARRQPAPR